MRRRQGYEPLAPESEQTDQTTQKPSEENQDGGFRGRKICLVFLVSMMFTFLITLVIGLMLSTSTEVIPNLNLPQRIVLNSFSAGWVTFSDHAIEGAVFLKLKADSTAKLGPIEATKTSTHINGRLTASEIVLGESQHVKLRNNQLYVDYDDPIIINSSTYIFGVLSPPSMSFSTFTIRERVLTNTAPKTLSDDPVELFKVSGQMIAVARAGVVAVYSMNRDERRPVLVWEKEVSGIERIESFESVFKFIGSEGFTLDCRDGVCKETEIAMEIEDGDSVVDFFGTRWDLDRKKCVIRENNDEIVEYDLGRDCENAKLGLTQELKVFVVVPSRQIVRFFDNNDSEEVALKSPVMDKHYEIVPGRAAIVFLREGEFEFEVFDL